MDFGTNNSSLAKAALTAALVCFSGSTGIAQSVRVNLPDGVYFNRFAASVSGPEAIWVNPAALAENKTPSALIMFDYRAPGYADDRGSAVISRGFGYSYRKLAELPPGSDFTEHIFSVASSDNSGTSLGFSYRYISNGPLHFNNRHLWNASLLYRKQKNWSVAAVFSNLNRGKIDGRSSDVEQVFSGAYRPLGNDRLTVSAEVELSHKQNFKDGIVRVGAEGEPMRGLRLFGSWDEEKNIELGVRVNFARSYVGGQSRHAGSSEIQSATSYVGFLSDRQRSIMRSIIKVHKRQLRISLNGTIEENPTQPIFGKQKLAFWDYIQALYRAATDESVGALTLVIGPNSLNWGQAQEIKRALENLRSVGKPVIAYLAEATNRNFYLACSADSIVLAPVGYLGLTGLHVEQTFLAGTLEKIGVSVEEERIGDYKSATEMFTRTDATAANQEMMNRLLDNLYLQFVSEIAQKRSMSAERVRQLIDSGPLTSVEAKDAGLVDELLYPDQLDKQINREFAEKVGLRSYLSERETPHRWGAPPVIAVIVTEGEIGDSPPGGDTFITGAVSPQSVKRAFSQVASDGRVKGVTLRVNSPGGSALASDLIYRQTELARQIGPLNVSMSGVAASGGYYISAAANRIFANPATITGSIGIFALKPNLSEMYKKIGLNKRLYSRGKNAGLFTFSRESTDSERERISFGLRAMYQRFLEVAAGGRSLTTDSVNQLGEGRVWTGLEANSNGLVDTLGGLWETIGATAQQAGLTEYEIKLYPRKRTLFSFGGNPLLGPFRLLSSLLLGDRSGSQQDGSAELAWLFGNQRKGYYMRLPFDLTIE